MVCDPCNTGWMSDLEAETKAIVEPMTYGHSVVLSVIDQLKVASWATQIALLLRHSGAPRQNEYYQPGGGHSAARGVARRAER